MQNIHMARKKVLQHEHVFTITTLKLVYIAQILES